MNAQQKNVLLNAIAAHVQAQIELSWSGSQPVQDHATYQEDAREAEAELIAIIDTLTDPCAAHVLRLQNEVRFLNRAMQRKNRRLKGQYDALKGQRKMFDIQVLYSEEGSFAPDVPLHIKRIEGRSDGTRIIVSGGSFQRRPLDTETLIAAMEKAGVAVGIKHLDSNYKARWLVYKYANTPYNSGMSAEYALNEALAGAK